MLLLTPMLQNSSANAESYEAASVPEQGTLLLLLAAAVDVARCFAAVAVDIAVVVVFSDDDDP
jgi:hypothetical protein